MKTTLIFDFDGTIADTLDACVRIYNELAPKIGCKAVKDGERDGLRGKASKDFLRDYGVRFWNLPVIAWRVRKGLRREMEKLPIIPGMREALLALRAEGYGMGIVSSNSVENIEVFLRVNGLGEMFQFIHSGRNLFGKDRVLRKVIERHDIESALYIGDEVRDIEAARKVGMPIISVGWGFNLPSILEKMNPGMVVQSPKEFTPSYVRMVVIEHYEA